MGTEKIMIQSKPRGSDIDANRPNNIVMASNRSRSKKATLVNTQPEGEINSSDGNIVQEGQNAATQNNVEAFEQDSSYANQ